MKHALGSLCLHKQTFRNLPDLPLSALLRCCFRHVEDNDDGRRYYAYARYALLDAFRLLGVKSGDVVLFPDYICDVTLVPCNILGTKVRYYPVDDQLQPDWEQLERLSEGCRAVMSVNYFGFPQDMQRWRNFADAKGLAWIEDNAHGYGSKCDGRRLGEFGDVSITSQRKVLPLLDGAMLQVNDRELKGIASGLPPLPAGRIFADKAALKRVAVWMAAWAGLGLQAARGANSFSSMPPCEERGETVGDGISRLSGRLLRAFDLHLDDFVTARRGVYHLWERFCAEHGLSAVFPSLPDGASPMAFACYAPDFETRQYWLQWAACRRIRACPWPSLPMPLRETDTPSYSRWRRLICFPIHQYMDVSMLERVLFGVTDGV